MAESYGGIVLAGGKSTRMGTSKAMLPFGSETMLQRVVRLLGEVVSPIVVVAAEDQELPELPPEVIVARDERKGRGPLEGLRAGLKALPAGVDAAYVTSCDVPLLVPGFVRQMIELLDGYDIAVMDIDGFAHPLSAIYKRSTLPRVEDLLSKDQLRPVFLFDAMKTRRIRPEEMTADPDLRTLQNLNTREDYERALAESVAATEPPVVEAESPASETPASDPAPSRSRGPLYAVVAIIAGLMGVMLAFAAVNARPAVEGYGYLFMAGAGAIGAFGVGLLLCIPKPMRAFGGGLMLAGIALGGGFVITFVMIMKSS